MMDTPLSLKSLIIRNNASTSLSVSEDVGSSMITTFAFMETAFAISTDCIWEIERVPSFALGS